MDTLIGCDLSTRHLCFAVQLAQRLSILSSQVLQCTSRKSLVDALHTSHAVDTVVQSGKSIGIYRLYEMEKQITEVERREDQETVRDAA